MLRQIDYIYSQPEGSYTKEGKIIPFINYQRSAPERCLDMLLAKYYGESYQSEVLMDLPEKRSVPELRCDLRKATILLTCAKRKSGSNAVHKCRKIWNV